MNIIVSIFVVIGAVLIAAQASASPAPSGRVAGGRYAKVPVTGPASPAASIPRNCTLDPWTGDLTCYDIAAPKRIS